MWLNRCARARKDADGQSFRSQNTADFPKDVLVIKNVLQRLEADNQCEVRVRIRQYVFILGDASQALPHACRRWRTFVPVYIVVASPPFTDVHTMSIDASR